MKSFRKYNEAKVGGDVCVQVFNKVLFNDIVSAGIRDSCPSCVPLQMHRYSLETFGKVLFET